MAEVVLSVIAKLAEYLVDPTLRQVQYLLCVGKITKNVGMKKEDLIFRQGRVQERVEEAVNQTERIDDEVNKWKNEVENLLVEVENLEKELKANPGCFQRWFPTWRRYCLCKKLVKRTLRMVELNTKGDQFNPFSHPVIVPSIEYHSFKNFVYFKSTKMASEKLWEALQDDECFIIGLYGMGGSGKTTLVKKVGKDAKDSKRFDRVVFTTVSQTQKIREIQGEIADSLGLKLDEESETGRARRIALRMQNGERILMILDDVWAKLNLQGIGIPLEGNHQKSCKVLLTTRRREVCSLMDCQKNIPLHLLTEDEAWNLFQIYADVYEGAREVVAREIAKECKGLPVAIETVGTCLKGKGFDEMNVILHRLRHSKPIDVDEGVRDVFTCLELSYDYLRSSEAKLLFLACAMFPEDHKIIIEDIFRYGIGLGLCKDADSFEIARSQLRVAINILIDSSLLMYSDESKRLTMHDMVRDIALWIASKKDRTIMVKQAKELNELIMDEGIKDCYAISAWDNNREVHQFPCQLDAPKLEILLLNSRNSLELSQASFDGIKGLKVMAVEGTIVLHDLIGSLPQSISCLSNLRTLRLRGWKLGDISPVVRLTRLEILDLENSKFQKLPHGIEKLNKLKLLDLSCSAVDECCFKVIGRCSQLEELYVYTYDRNINCHECLMGETAFPKLRRFTLQMGKCRIVNMNLLGTRVLGLGQLNISTSSAIIKDLARRASAITFNELHGGYKSFIPDVVQVVGGMNDLTQLCLRSCSEIECLTNKIAPYEDVTIPSLVQLKLVDMENLERLCHGPPLLSLFQNLESLEITKCPMLTSLFPVSVACTLLSLRCLTIRRCSELKHLIEGEDGADACKYFTWPSMKKVYWEDCPKLSASCDSLLRMASELRHPDPNKELHAINGHQLRNEESKPLVDVSHIESIRLDSCGLNIILQIPRFEHLTELHVFSCEKLKFVFSASMCQNLPELTHIRIRKCEELEEIFVKNEETLSNQSKVQVSLPKLRSLEIWQCDKLRIIFSVMIPVATSILPQLSTLMIIKAAQLEEIFGCTNLEDHATYSEKEIMLPNLKDIRFENLPRLANVCHGLKLHIPEFCTVLVHKCPKFLPFLGARSHRIPEGLVRKFVLNCSQLSNDEAFTLPLFVLNTGEHDIPSSRVHEMFRVIDDDDLPATDSGTLGYEHKILKCLIPTQVLRFQYLHTLEVIRCKKLKFLFSVDTILHNSLPKLTLLTLSDCEELEEIIADYEEPQNIWDVQVCFPKLRVLEVRGCNKLKRLFSTTMATVPAELQYLEIIGCSQLKQVFSCELEIHDGGLDKNVLPKLEEFKFEALPNLTDICAGFPFQLQFPSLLSCVIEDCPTFSETTLAALNSFLPRHKGSPDACQQSKDACRCANYEYHTTLGFLTHKCRQSGTRYGF